MTDIINLLIDSIIDDTNSVHDSMLKMCSESGIMIVFSAVLAQQDKNMKKYAYIHVKLCPHEL